MCSVSMVGFRAEGTILSRPYRRVPIAVPIGYNPGHDNAPP